jgi:hypothetical protein
LGDFGPGETLHGVNLPVAENGISLTSTEGDQGLGLHSRSEGEGDPLLDGGVMEYEGSLLLLGHGVVDEDGRLICLSADCQEAFHGGERHAGEASVALDALEVGLALVSCRIADYVVASGENDPLVVDEVDVVPDVGVHTEDVFQLDLLGGLDGRDHLSHGELLKYIDEAKITFLIVSNTPLTPSPLW